MRWLKFILNLAFGLIAGVALYLAVAVFLSVLPTHPHELNCEKNNEIFISSNGIHLDIIIPKQYLTEEFKNQMELPPSTRFVAFGWGDKQFYLKTPEWSDLTLSVAFRAIFLKSEAAMHVTRYDATYQSWVKVPVCETQLAELKNFIESSFRKDEQGNIIWLQVTGYNSNDSFYEAKGSFSLFTTCNVWVNRALKEIDVETSVWSPFEFGVLHHLP